NAQRIQLTSEMSLLRNNTDVEASDLYALLLAASAQHYVQHPYLIEIEIDAIGQSRRKTFSFHFKVICPGGKIDERVLAAFIACTRRGKFVVCIAKREPSIADYGLGLVGHGAAQPAPDFRCPGP